jgi:peptide-methionine (S)-S-oxide reductase
VIVHYNPDIIPLEVLIAIQLHTHASTKEHSFQEKYRSAIYIFDEEFEHGQNLIYENQMDFNEKIITTVLKFEEFKSNIEKQKNYYQNKKKVFFVKGIFHQD